MRDSYFSIMSSLGETYYGQTVQAFSYVGKEITSSLTAKDIAYITATVIIGGTTFGIGCGVVGGVVSSLDPLSHYLAFESSDHNYFSQAFLVGLGLYSFLEYVQPQVIEACSDIMNRVDTEDFLHRGVATIARTIVKAIDPFGVREEELISKYDEIVMNSSMEHVQ